VGVKILERTGADILECMGAIIGICTHSKSLPDRAITLR
jgi:hypothetical protein